MAHATSLPHTCPRHALAQNGADGLTWAVNEPAGEKADAGIVMGNADSSPPNVARIYDYYLGGTNNYPQDREAARKVLGTVPDVPLAALENREFLRRAIRYLTEEAGIRQFLDIGPGLPTQGNVHQLARQHNADARVVYVDNDPAVIGRAQSLLHGLDGVTIVKGDLRQPERIIANPQLREPIDFSHPVALCMSLVLHFLTNAEDPYRVVTLLREVLCPGSYS